MTVFVRWPVDMPAGWISQDIFERNSWESQPHQGIDIAAPAGTPIYAPCDGFIVWASFDTFPPGNTWEMIPHNTGSGGCTILQPLAPHTALQTSFSHQSEILVSPGQFVRAGQIIGRVGSTGNSTGDHVHWEAFIDYAEGVYPAGTFYGRVDPKQYFKTSTVVPTASTGGKGSPNTQEEDDMPSFSDRILDTIDGKKASLNEIINSIDRKQDQQGAVLSRLAAALDQNMKLTSGILATRIPDPTDPKKSYTIADYIVWGATNAKNAAGNSGRAVQNTDPTVLAKAVSEAQAGLTAQAVADQLIVNITTKEPTQ